MYVHEAAVIGGGGGGAFSHEESLQAAGYSLGAGATCMRLSRLHVEQWQVLSHHSATYTSVKDPSKTVTTQGQGSIRGGADASTDFEIRPGHRVVRVCASAGDRSWAAGAYCLNSLEIETVPVIQEDDDTQPTVTAIGTCWLQSNLRCAAGTYKIGTSECKVLIIPEGLTLAGIATRAGESWDQVTLLVGPWLPAGGQWSPSVHRHLVAPFKQQARALLLSLHQLQCSGAIQPLDRQVTECLVAALFEATFLPPASSTQPPAAAAGGAEAPGSSSLQPAAVEAAGVPGGCEGLQAAGSARADCVGAWVQQQVQQARAACEEVWGAPGLGGASRVDWNLLEEELDSLGDDWEDVYSQGSDDE